MRNFSIITDCDIDLEFMDEVMIANMFSLWLIQFIMTTHPISMSI